MGRKEWANIVLCLIIFGATAYGIHCIAGASDVVDLFNPEAVASTSAVNLEKEVRLDSAEFEINGVTKGVKARFEITNGSHGTVKDIVISCDYKDKNDELRGRGQWVVYDKVPPSQSVFFLLEERRYISYLVDPERIACRIVDLTGSVKPAGKTH